MASKRMFAREQVESDAFSSLGLTSQALFFHICLAADDWGAVASPNRVARGIGASAKDLKALTDGGFLIVFDSGVMVVRDWWLHNTITPARRKDSTHRAELAELDIVDGVYVRKAGPVQVQLIPEAEPEPKPEPKRFKPPTLEEVEEYAKKMGSTVNPSQFVDFYESKGWMVGKNKMKDWKAAFRTWMKRNGDKFGKGREKDEGYESAFEFAVNGQ